MKVEATAGVRASAIRQTGQPGTVPRRRRVGGWSRIAALGAGLALAPSLLVGGCGSNQPVAARTTLAKALEMVDNARSFHVSYATTGTPQPGQTLAVSGTGDFLRPTSFRGTFEVDDSGLPVSVSVVVVNGASYLQLPFSGYQKVQLPKYGFPDPVELFDPENGLTAAFRKTSDLSYNGTMQEGPQTLLSLTGYVPDSTVAAALHMSKARASVKVTYGVDRASGRLVSVSMVGPFLAPDRDSVVTITLTRYGEAVSLAVPS